MQKPTIEVKKLTDVELMRRACSMTFNGTSKQTLLSMYKSEHSPARTQLFWIECLDIPLFVATHLIRHHVGSQPFQLSKRDDRPSGKHGFVERIDNVISRLDRANDFGLEGDWMAGSAQVYKAIDELSVMAGECDRMTPVNLGILVNAQSLIDMAKLRCCNTSHSLTISVFNKIKEQVATVDPDLAAMMVRKCVHRNGLCGEPHCCGFNNTQAFQTELKQYAHNFTKKQLGIMYQNHESKTSPEA